MNRFLAALTALCLLAGASVDARAQAANPTSAPPSARQLQLAQQILDETGMTKNYDTMMRDLFARIGAQTSAMVGDSAKAKDNARAFNEAMTASILKIKPQLLELSRNAYAQTFTEEELEGILSFYRTPVGQSMSAKMPLLTRNIGEATSKLMPQMMATMLAETCARVPERCAAAGPRSPTPKTPTT